MEMRFSDIIDRYCILKMKTRFDESLSTETDFHLSELINEFKKAIGEGISLHLLLESIVTLAESNGRIWENEAAIRKEIDNDPSAKQTLTLEEIGRRTLMIRSFNKNRTDAKTQIDGLLGLPTERKFDHASGANE